MRSISPELIVALSDRTVQLRMAELLRIFDPGAAWPAITWTTYNEDIEFNEDIYLSNNPWLTRSRFKLTNTMAIPSIDIRIIASNTIFFGGLDLKSQVHNGLLDRGEVTLNRMFFNALTNERIGTILIFSGYVGPIQPIDGNSITFTCKGGNNLFTQNIPRRLYQVGCGNSFCDAGCTLNPFFYTATFVVDSGATRTFVPWTVAPANPEYYQWGMLTVTNGPAAREERTITFADSSGVTLVYPLYNIPEPGDEFSAFEGCDKTLETCERRSNSDNRDAFPFIPAPSSMVTTLVAPKQQRSSSRR